MKSALTLSARICIVAAACNALVSTVYVTRFFSEHIERNLFLLLCGITYSAICALPLLLLLWEVLDRCAAKGISKMQTLQATMIAALGFAIGIFIVVHKIFQPFPLDFFPLLIICVLSVIIGVASQSRSILSSTGVKPQKEDQ
jgi:hypothetical protein